VRGEVEYNEGVPLSIQAALPFHHLLKDTERQRRRQEEEAAKRRRG